VLNRAITGVKTIVKVSMNVLKLEKQAKEAAHQTASWRETGLGADTSRLLANEQEALLLAAFANEALAACVSSYHLFHTLAVHIAGENFESMLQSSIEQCDAALEVVKRDIDEMKDQKERKEVERRAVTAGDDARQAHLLINEQTGAITLKDGVSAFHLQDLAGIDQAPAQERPGHSRLWFKESHPCSRYDVPHDLLHEGCEARTR